jgi:hypothetical protein
MDRGPLLAACLVRLVSWLSSRLDRAKTAQNRETRTLVDLNAQRMSRFVDAVGGGAGNIQEICPMREGEGAVPTVESPLTRAPRGNDSCQCALQHSPTLYITRAFDLAYECSLFCLRGD